MNPRNNQCLEMLPERDFQLLLPHLKLRSLSAGEKLYEGYSRPDKLYFPVNALIAIRKDTPDGLSISGVTGNSYHHGIVAESGFAYQLNRDILQSMIDLHPMITKMCMRAAQLIIRKISMEFLCTHYHLIHQRVSRWILTRHDCMLGDDLPMTHQAISNSLGIRREAVTLALSNLAGVQVSRGHLKISDRMALEHQSCECYFHLKQVHPRQISLSF